MKNPKLRVKAAAEYLCLSSSTMAKMRLRGDGPSYSKAGRICLYDIDDLDDWLDKNKYCSTSEYT